MPSTTEANAAELVLGVRRASAWKKSGSTSCTTCATTDDGASPPLASATGGGRRGTAAGVALDCADDGDALGAPSADASAWPSPDSEFELDGSVLEEVGVVDDVVAAAVE